MISGASVIVTLTILSRQQWNRLGLVVLGFNTTLTAKVIIMAVGDTLVFSGLPAPVLTELSFQCYRLLSSNASVEVRSKNMPERNNASTEYRTHNHKVMSLTSSPLSNSDGVNRTWDCLHSDTDTFGFGQQTICGKKNKCSEKNSLGSPWI